MEAKKVKRRGESKETSGKKSQRHLKKKAKNTRKESREKILRDI